MKWSDPREKILGSKGFETRYKHHRQRQIWLYRETDLTRWRNRKNWRVYFIEAKSRLWLACKIFWVAELSLLVRLGFLQYVFYPILQLFQARFDVFLPNGGFL